MKMFLKKTAAAVVAVALIGGAAPAMFGSPTLLDTTITANAATKTIEVGQIYKFGDSIDFGLGAYIETGFAHSLKFRTDPTGELQKCEYVGDAFKEYHFIFSNYEIITKSPNIGIPDGIIVTGGSGTESDPFTFAPYFTPSKPELNYIFKKNDSIDFGDGYYIVTNVQDTISVSSISGIQKVTYNAYSDFIGKCSFSLGNQKIYIDNTKDSIPDGITVKSGTGTEADPIYFDLYYAPKFKLDSIFKFDEVIDFGSTCYFVTSEIGHPTRIIDGSYTLSYDSYIEKYQQHKYNLIDADGNTIAMYCSGTSEKPDGIYISGGSGKHNDPFKFEAYYAPRFSIGDVFFIGDTIDFGSYCWRHFWSVFGVKAVGERIVKYNTTPDARADSHFEFALLTDEKMADSAYETIDSEKVPTGLMITDDIGYSIDDYVKFKVVYDDAILKGASITLDGNIGVNFYANLSSNVAKAVLSGPSGDVEITDFASLKQPNNTYKLTYEVNATQANSPITLKCYDINGEQIELVNSNCEPIEGNSFSYSVNDYIADSANYSSDEKLSTLVNALDNYCKAADNYFNGASNVLGKVSDLSVFDESYNPKYSANTDLLAGCKIALVMNSRTAIRVFYDGDAKSATWNCNQDEEHTVQIKSNSYGNYFEIPNVAANNITDVYYMTIGDNEKKIICNPLMYGYLAKTKSTDTKLQALCCALYDYAQAADTYID